MTAISAPSTFRNYNKVPPINASVNDATNKEGVRISLPIYIDLPTNLRKQLLNEMRSVCNLSLIHI